jgi:hypothetical protein
VRDDRRFERDHGAARVYRLGHFRAHAEEIFIRHKFRIDSLIHRFIDSLVFSF